MTKHQWIKSIFSSHIDPETDEELKGTKIETEGKFQKILNLIKDENEDSNKEPLVELIEDFHKQYQLLYDRYDHITGELRQKVHGKEKDSSSSSSSDSDSDKSHRIKSSKNGRRQSKIEKLTDGIRHELEIANLEIVDLKSKLAAVSEESEVLNSKYHIVSRKVQETEEEVKRLVAEGEKLKHENADILINNKDLIVKLQCASEMEAQLNHQLEEVKNAISILTSEKEAAVSTTEEERKVSDNLRAITAQVRDEREVLQLELDAVKGEVYVTKDNLQSAQQEIENLNQIQKVINEEKNSLSLEVVTLSKEIEQAHHKIQDLVTESSQLREKLNGRETELLTFKEMHEAHLSETDTRTRDLQLNLETLQSHKTKMEKQKDDELSVLLMKLEENERDFLSQIQHLTAEKSTLSEEIKQLQEKIEEIVTESSLMRDKMDGREIELLTHKETHEAYVRETDARTRDLEQKLETLHLHNTEMEKEKDDQLSALLMKLEDKERDLLSQTEHLTTEKSMLSDEIKQLQDKIQELVTESSKLKETMDNKEIDFLTLKGIHESHENEATNRIRNLELELETLHSQKHEMEKQKDHELSLLLIRLEDKEKDALFQLELLKEDINQLQLRVETLQTQKSELEELLVQKSNEASSQFDELMIQINEKQCELESLQSQIHESDALLGKKDLETSEYLIQMESLKEELSRKTADHLKLQEENKGHIKQGKDLELQVDMVQNKIKELEDQLGEQINDIDQLRKENEDLKDKISGLEKTLSEREDQSSALEKKLEEASIEASTLIDASAIEMNKLQQELESLRTENLKLQEENEGHIKQGKDLELQVDMVQNKVKELEDQLGEQASEIDQLRKENEDLKDKISGLEKTLSEREDQTSSLEKKIEEASVEASALLDASAIEMNKLQQELESLHAENLKLQEENEGHVKLGKDLELQVDMVQNKIKELEDQLGEQTNEIDQLRKENEDLKDKISGLEKTSSEREDQYSALEKKLEEASIEASALLDASAVEMNKLQQELESLHAEKSQLELLAEKDKQESAKSLAEVEDQKIELIRKIKEQECTLKEQEVAFNELTEVHKQLEVSLIECKENLQAAERKVEEMTKEFHNSMELNTRKFNELEEILKEVERELEIKRDELEESIEDLKRELEMKGDEVATLTENVRNIEVKLRLSNQKLRITEQVLSEKENEHTAKEEKYQKDNKVLHERIIILSGVLSAYKEDQFKMKAVFTEQLNQTFTGLDSLTRKLEEDSGHIETCVFEILNELQVAKSWVRDKNNNEENQKKKIANLIFELNSVRQQESLLREQIENLVKTVKQLEVKMEKSNNEKDEKMGAMEKRLNEKDEWISGLGEEKKEAIRQLCIWNDYHRERCVYLEEIITNRIGGRRQLRT